MGDVSIEDAKTKKVKIKGETFTIRKLSFGQALDAQSKYLDVNPVTGDFKVDSAGMTIARILGMLQDWTLTDEDGNKLEINEENVKNLTEEVGSKLDSECMKLSGGPPRDLIKKLGGK